MKSVNLEKVTWVPSKQIMKKILQQENLTEETIIQNIKNGTMCVLASKYSSNNPKFKPCIIGTDTRKKTCVAIGTDSKIIDHFNSTELKIILNAEPDAVCDVSIGSNIPKFLSMIREDINVPLGSCPTYDILNESVTSKISKDYVLNKIESHLKSGVDFILIHFGFSIDMLEHVRKSNRIIPTTSRGGGTIMRYMKMTGEENPFLLYADDIISLCKKYEVVLDTGDIFRTGCIEDGHKIMLDDDLKANEITIIKTIQEKARKEGVQIVCEAGGHVPMNIIPEFVKWLKNELNGAPVWFNGPLPTDRAIGFDSTANSIGVSIAASSGGDMFLALTDAEHYAKPTPQQSAQAIRTTKVALSAASYTLNDQTEIELNHKMGKARQERNWVEQAEFSLYPRISKNLFSKENLLSHNSQPCSLCGPLCPLLVNK